MKHTIIATYRRKSTLWKNANAFYKSQDWTKMTCSIYDFTEEIHDIEEVGMKWFAKDGTDITDQEIERRYGNAYYVRLETESGNNSKSYSFKTKEEANEFVKAILNHKILGNFKRVA